MKVHSVGKLIHGVITRLSGTGPVRIPTKTRGGSREAGGVGEAGGIGEKGGKGGKGGMGWSYGISDKALEECLLNVGARAPAKGGGGKEGGGSMTVKQVCVKVVAIFLRTTNDEVHSDPMSVDIVRGE